MGKSSRTVHRWLWSRTIFQACRRVTVVVCLLGSSIGSSRGGSACISDCRFQVWRNASSQIMCRRCAVLPPADVSPLLSACVTRWPRWFRSRGQESAPVDSGLVAVAVPFAQRLPGLQPLRPHPLTVIQVVHPAAQRVLPVWPEEVHAQDLPPGERGERVGPASEPHAGSLSSRATSAPGNGLAIASHST